MRNFFGPSVVVLVAAVTMAGCAVGAGNAGDTEPTKASSAPTRTPSPTTSAAPTAEAEAPAAAEKVIIATAGVTIQRADGQTQEFAYFDPTQPLVDALTEAFGQDPVVTHNTPEEPGPSTSSVWSGFTVSDPESPVGEPYSVEFSVFTDVAEVGGVIIESKEGAQVGDPALEAVNLYPVGPSDFTNDQGGQGAMFSTDFIDLPGDGTDSNDSLGRTFATALTANDLDAGLTSIYAPSPNWLQ